MNDRIALALAELLSTGRGKRIPPNYYFHSKLVETVPVAKEIILGLVFDLGIGLEEFNVVKLSRQRTGFSLLLYESFIDEAFPRLAHAISVNETWRHIRRRTYGKDNPPILHRKELLLPANDPAVEGAGRLTEALERCGLLENPKSIGYQRAWERRLRESGYRVNQGLLEQRQ
jgi:hypothetical protein